MGEPASPKFDFPILAVDDDPSFLLFLTTELKKVCPIVTVRGLDEALERIKSDDFSLVLLDIGLGKENGLQALREIRAKKPDLDVVMVSGQKDPRVVIESVRAGAIDYLVKPFEIEELIAVIEKLRPLRRIKERHTALVEGINRIDATFVVGNSGEFQAMLRVASKIKGNPVSILIEGESGTGKELLARHIHQQEGNPKRPFVAVNCAAIPENLLESELFGHEKGSFTGATTRKIGQFELADGGDIFLDEVSCLKWDLQAKLLRVLQEQQFSRVGGTETIRSDFRVIAASNENLEKLVEEAKFRRDLYHRLRVIVLKVPALRQRREDIPLLVETFLKKYDSEKRHQIKPEVFQIFQSYSWPGNIRELENLIRSLVILVEGEVIRKENLPRWVFGKSVAATPSSATGYDHLLPTNKEQIRPLEESIGPIERAYIEKTLELIGGDKTKAATLLKISRSGLYDRLKGWGLL